MLMAQKYFVMALVYIVCGGFVFKKNTTFTHVDYLVRDLVDSYKETLLMSFLSGTNVKNYFFKTFGTLLVWHYSKQNYTIMKKQLLLVILSIFIFACGSSKRIQKELSYGNYDNAINASLKKLQANKHKKSKADYKLLLNDAYKKAVSKDTQRIAYLKQNNNPADYETVYKLYKTLHDRQEKIKPILPLSLNGKEILFDFKNYNTEIIKAKENFVSYLYKNANVLLNSNSKIDNRKAFNDLKYVDQLMPNYKNTKQLKELAYEKGTDYVIVAMVNKTEQVIPQRLEDDLLNFNTYGLDDFWTVYHNNIHPNKKYNFAINLILRNISISPEQIKEREIIKEKQIKDGWKHAVDKNGNFLKDSLGNKIKVDKFKNIRCVYNETRQFKVSSISCIVEFKNLDSRQLIESFPLQSEYLFEHFYATSRGDRRALNQDLMDYLDNRAVPFPSNEQMVYDTGEDLKLQLKRIITNNSFR